MATVHQTIAEDMFVYRVCEHKTPGQFGSANIVLSKKIHDMITGYIAKHRPTPLPENEEYAFLTRGGRKVYNVPE